MDGRRQPRKKIRREHLTLAAAAIEAEQRRGLLDDPVLRASTVLRVFFWSKQREIAYAVRDHRRVAVRSSHGVGKTFVSAVLAAWWIASHPPGTAFVVTTAPTFRQVRSVFWRELGRAHAKGQLPGRLNQAAEWWLGDRFVALGLKPAAADPMAFQGIHARFVLVIIDEAAGVPAALWDAASSLISNEESRFLAIGNPDDPSSHFAAVCRPGSGFHVIGISAFDSPNFTSEEVPADLRPLLVGPTWEGERAAEWGLASPMYIAKVLGQFPDSASDSVIPLSCVLACQRDPISAEIEAAWERNTPVELGVDVGAGGDQTVIYARYGPRAELVWRGQTPDAAEVTGHVVDAIRTTGATTVKIDIIGVGWGIESQLQELRGEGVHRATIVPVSVSQTPYDPNRFVQLRDEIWWEVGRELSRTQGWDLRSVDDTTIAQLVAPRYATDSRGRIKVEPKKATKARLGRSPDEADALLLCFYQPVVPYADPAFVYGVVPCVKCGDGYVWSKGGWCWHCGNPAPPDHPYADRLPPTT
jgi:hypothetical protein